MKNERPRRASAGPSNTGCHPEDLLTQEEVAARLKVTLRTVVRLQHEGLVPFILLGKAVRFFWPAVVAHLIDSATVVRGADRTQTREGAVARTARRPIPSKIPPENFLTQRRQDAEGGGAHGCEPHSCHGNEVLHREPRQRPER